MKKNKLYKINTSKLWNSYNYVKKYNDFKYSKQGDAQHLNTRRDRVLDYLENSNTSKKITILELGYGAGQNAKYFIPSAGNFSRIILKPFKKISDVEAAGGVHNFKTYTISFSINYLI